MTIAMISAFTRVLTAIAFTLAAMTTGPVAAAPVLLEVILADGSKEQFDRKRLEELPLVEFTTTSLWTNGPTTFSGPSLRAVLDAAGIEEGEVELIAANGYSADVGCDDELLTETYPIVATRRDGEAFSIRENGPLWVMFPLDDNPDLKVRGVYGLSVWQLVLIRQSAE